MPEVLDRPALKQRTRELLHTARVSPLKMTALYSGILLLLGLADYAASGLELAGIFTSMLSMLAGWVLGAGFTLYCVAIRRQERVEYAALFDGFSLVGPIIALNIVMRFFISMWSLLFVIPGIIASYRYRFALYNLYENPGMNIMMALELSKRQTQGYKMQLFMLDLSYMGWFLLASLPSAVYEAWTLWQTGFDPAAYMAAATPLWVMLVCNLWSLAAALFYLPNYECVALDYYDAARARFSGTLPSGRSDSPEGF